MGFFNRCLIFPHFFFSFQGYAFIAFGTSFLKESNSRIIEPKFKSFRDSVTAIDFSAKLYINWCDAQEISLFGEKKSNKTMKKPKKLYNLLRIVINIRFDAIEKKNPKN